MNIRNDMPTPSKAAELCKYFTVGAEARKVLDPEMSPEEFLKLCQDRKWYSDAIQFLAHYLPKRQGVFWALTCVRQGAGPDMSAEAEVALKAAERWIADPTDDNRKAALKASEDADSSTPAGATALAAYYSAGQPHSDDPKTNARGYFMTAKLVSGAVMLAATVDRETALTNLDASVTKGMEIVRRTKGKGV